MTNHEQASKVDHSKSEEYEPNIHQSLKLLAIFTLHEVGAMFIEACGVLCIEAVIKFLFWGLSRLNGALPEWVEHTALYIEFAVLIVFICLCAILHITRFGSYIKKNLLTSWVKLLKRWQTGKRDRKFCRVRRQLKLNLQQTNLLKLFK